jgi:hypothetical protein
MRHSLSILAALAIAAPLAAQQQAGMAGMNHDATHVVKGSGKLPDGWSLRYDPQRNNTVPALDAVVFEKTGSGYHFTSGPAAIYYNAKDMGMGDGYAIKATFSQKKSMMHEAYGIFIGGRNLQDSTQTYTYFILKPCSSKCGTAGAPMGEIAINQRTSNGKPAVLLPAQISDAAHTEAADGSATNEMSIHVAKDAVHFILNGKLVAEIPRSKIGNTDGLTGIRVNHNMDLDVTWSGVVKQ